MSIEDAGIYYLGSDQLATALGLPLKTIRSLVQKGRLALSSQDGAVAYGTDTKGAGLTFYGEAIDTIYTDQNVYWLEVGAGQLMGAARGGKKPKGPCATATFREQRHIEQDVMEANGGYMDPEDFWIWNYLVSGSSALDQKNYTAVLPDVVASDTQAELTATLWGASTSGVDQEHHVVVLVNGTQVGEQWWTGTIQYPLSCTFSQGLLTSGTNTITLKAYQDDGIPYSAVFIDSFDVTYERLARAENDRLLMRAGARGSIAIEGFTDPDIQVLDVSDARNPQVISKTRVDGGEGRYGVTFEAAASASYYAWSPVATQTADPEVDSPSDLRSTANAADYVIITDAALKPAAEELAAWRHTQGLTTLVVDFEDVCDEFSAGLYAPKAIQAFLAYAHTSWAQAPLYVVLAGDGTYDYKEIRGKGRNVVPALLVQTEEGLFPSDNWYADVDGDSVPEMAIGRLPAATVDELQQLVAKLIAYDTEPDGAWMRQALLAADNPDPDAGDFTVDSELLAADLPADFALDRAYLETLTLTAARQLVMNSLNQGRSLFQYVGHANMNALAAENLFTRSNAGQLTNGARLPVMTIAACSTGMFATPGYTGLGETMLMRVGGGAVAVWSPSGSAYNENSTALLDQFLQLRYSGGEQVLGAAIVGAMEAYRDTGHPVWLLDIFTLLGDPATMMK